MQDVSNQLSEAFTAAGLECSSVLGFTGTDNRWNYLRYDVALAGQVLLHDLVYDDDLIGQAVAKMSMRSKAP